MDSPASPSVSSISIPSVVSSVYCDLCAPYEPLNLSEYCKAYNVCFFDLKLDCVFCRFTVRLSELAEFQEKNLSMIWKDHVPFVACRNCLRLSARLERERYCTCTVRGDLFDALTCQDISVTSIRCLLCLRLLDQAEKVDIKAGNKEVHRVRGYWRAPCRYCKYEGQCTNY